MSNNKFMNWDQYLNEAETSVANEKPAQERFTMTTVKKAGAALFKTGSAQIDTNSAEFKKAVSDLSPLGPGEEVEVQGGASAVGSPSFNNKELARQRALNFVNALKSAGVKAAFTVIAPVVGKNTEYNSPGALAEQFVKYAYGRESFAYKQETAIDNTAAKMPKYDDRYAPVKTSPLKYVALKITFDSTITNSAEIIAAIKALSSTKGNLVKSVENITSKLKA